MLELNNTNDELVMKLLHYFITNRKYTPVIIKGIEGEIWLENMSEDYKIVRIVSSYIHNDEQFKINERRTKHLTKELGKKTLSWRMNILSIFINLGDNVHLDNFDKSNTNPINVHKTEDLNKYNFVIDVFPDITKKTNFKEKGMELFMKITSDISKKNEGQAKMNEEIFTIKKPYITIGLIIINVLIFILFGGNVPEVFAVSRSGVLNGEFYRLFTGMFFHANIVHLLVNCYALYIIGMQLESFIGRYRYLIVYILGGLGGSVLSIFMNSGYSVGASGAIFGLMGAMLYFGYHYRVFLENVLKSQIIPLIVLNLIIDFAFSSQIDVWGHIGGLVGGALALMATGVKYKSTKFEMINGLIIYIIYIGFFLYMVLSGKVS